MGRPSFQSNLIASYAVLRFFRTLHHFDGQNIPQIGIGRAEDFFENRQIVLPFGFDDLLGKVLDPLESKFPQGLEHFFTAN